MGSKLLIVGIVLVLAFACYGVTFHFLRPVIADLFPQATTESINCFTLVVVLILFGAFGSRSSSKSQ